MEPPGTAPGSDPLITSAFMSIVPKDTGDIGEVFGNLKRQAPWRDLCAVQFSLASLFKNSG